MYDLINFFVSQLILFVFQNVPNLVQRKEIEKDFVFLRIFFVILHWKKKFNAAPVYNKLLQAYRIGARPISVSLATPSFIDISG